MGERVFKKSLLTHSYTDEAKHKMLVIEVERWLDNQPDKPSEIIAALLNSQDKETPIRIACALSYDPKSAYLRLGMNERMFYRRVKGLNLNYK